MPTPVKILTVFVGTEMTGQIEFENGSKTHSLKMLRPAEGSRYEEVSGAFETMVPALAEALTPENRTKLIRQHSVFALYGSLLSKEAQAELLRKEVEKYDGRRLLAWDQVRAAVPASHPFAELITKPFVGFEPDLALMLFSEDFATVAVCTDEDVERQNRRAIENEMRDFFASREVRALLKCGNLL